VAFDLSGPYWGRYSWESKLNNGRVGIIGMVKLAIVEDEKILLDDLENNIDWEALEVTVAFTERNGINALRRI